MLFIMPKRPARTMSDLRYNPHNPREITPEQLSNLRDSVLRFGDLSGIVFNRKTGSLVGGHQRVKAYELESAEPKIEKRYPKPNAQGTVAEGFILVAGERFGYREVQWPRAMEEQAMVAANKHGGTWLDDKLRELFTELHAGKLDMELTMHSKEDIERIMRRYFVPTLEPGKTNGEQGKQGEQEPSISSGQVRMVTLLLTEITQPEYAATVAALGKRYRTRTATDTVIEAVRRQHERKSR